MDASKKTSYTGTMTMWKAENTKYIQHLKQKTIKMYDTDSGTKDIYV